MSDTEQPQGWPTAEVDPVRRLRALAGAVSGAAVTERVYDAPLDVVWGVLVDFEGSFADLQADLTEVRVLDRTGDRVEVAAKGRLGQRARLRGVARDGFCWLQSRFLIMAMAATEEGDGRTRVALTGGVRVPGRAAIVPVGVRRESRRTLDRLGEMLA
ncbi:hypothetical protein [Nocardioides speluncae]|uniref:hypothetical protein n=1 Tax=Nocardioides speluncae TaxID=2670337 RepID=UPI000D6874A3|nr:hypothetical protein [Nocardioides speluncae]